MIFVLIACLLIVSPLAAIWSLNELFLLDIPYTFWTWLAALILVGIVSGKKT